MAGNLGIGMNAPIDARIKLAPKLPVEHGSWEASRTVLRMIPNLRHAGGSFLWK